MRRTADRGAGMTSTDAAIAPPRRGLLVLEGRVLLELAASLPAYPLLRRTPRGDGHPVLVLPAFMASDFSTRVLRRFLRERGYSAHGWGLGRNFGPRPEMVQALGRRFTTLRERHGRKLSLIGWSLGGVYARELARRFAGDVRQVITLVAPFRNLDAVNLPQVLRAFGARRLHPDQAAQRELLSTPLCATRRCVSPRRTQERPSRPPRRAAAKNGTPRCALARAPSGAPRSDSV